MPQLEPTWQNLPTHFKKKLVGYLDLKSRVRLSSTFKANYDLVQSCALESHEIHLELFSAEPNDVYPDYFFRLLETRNSMQSTYAVFDSREEGIQFLMRLLEHPKSKVDTFEIGFNSQRGETMEKYCATMEEFSLKLASGIEKLGGRKLKTRSISFLSNFKTTETFLNILHCFDPSTLTQLRIQPRVSDEIMDKIIASEYWQNLNSLRLQRKTTVSIEKSLPPNAINLSVDRYCRDLRPQDVVDLVQTFIDRNSPWASYFQVLTTPDHRYDMEGTMRELTRICVDIERDERYTDFTFRMNRYDLVFVVRIFEIGVQGAVCHVESLQKDKEWLLRI